MTMPKELSSLIQEGNFNPSQVKVTEGDQNMMRPDVMNFLLLASAASQLVKIRKYYDDRTSEGFTHNFALTVTPAVQEIVLDYPAQSLYIINDGASPIFVEINRRHKTATPLNMGEDMTVDFETHKLKRFYIYCGPAGLATARATVKR